MLLESFRLLEMAMFCKKCGVSNEAFPDARFCLNCGEPIAVPGATTPSRGTSFDGPSTPPEGGKTDYLIGSTLDGKYRLDRQIAKGGMGTVYRGTRIHIGDTVAIKIVVPEKGADAEAAERFRREAQTAARLKHPNAVSIYDFGVSKDGFMYLVMEFVEGVSLREIIKQRGPLNAQITAEITSQVCAALEEAHRQNIIHRDIKPDNIIVNETPSGIRVKVLDFGIAKIRDLTISSLTQTGSVMGTAHYMSPEQCLGEALDSRSDVYSTGIVVYEMLCGRVPFNSPTSTAVAVQQVTQTPPPPRSINPGISPSVEAVVLHTLEKRREARPQTAVGLAQELKSAVYGHPFAQAVPVTRPTSGPVTQVITPVSNGGTRPASAPSYPSYSSQGAGRPKRRWPLVVGGLMVLAVLGLGGTALAWFLSRPSNTNKNQNNANQTRIVTGNESVNAHPKPSPLATPPSGPRDESKKQIEAAVNGWVQATESRDINALMATYYDKLTLYNKQPNVASSVVRTDKEHAIGMYSNMKVQLSNVNVVLDPDGDRGTAVFDKTWQFTGSSNFTGSSQEELKFFRTGGKWRITSERTIQVYKADYSSNKT
jgi:serine/threonine protein kinase